MYLALQLQSYFLPERVPYEAQINVADISRNLEGKNFNS